MNLSQLREVPEKQPLRDIRAFIRRHGSVPLSAVSGISERALRYVRDGSVPTRIVRERLEEMMLRERALRSVGKSPAGGLPPQGSVSVPPESRGPGMAST